MSTVIDNITLALLSAQEFLESYLNTNSWNRKYYMFQAGDPNLIHKKIVEVVHDPSNEVGLPLIAIQEGFTRNEPVELGEEIGQDVITLTVLLIARDAVQLTTLGNVIRRKLEDNTFDINDYSRSRKKKVGTGTFRDATLDNISNLGADHVANRHVALITVDIEMTAQDLI